MLLQETIQALTSSSIWLIKPLTSLLLFWKKKRRKFLSLQIQYREAAKDTLYTVCSKDLPALWEQAQDLSSARPKHTSYNMILTQEIVPYGQAKKNLMEKQSMHILAMLCP